MLDRWLIGYEPFSADEMDVAYDGVTDQIVGTDRTTCGTECGSFDRPGDGVLTANTCGGNAYALSAMRATDYYNGNLQWDIAQCCPASGSQPIRFSRKTCPLT